MSDRSTEDPTKQASVGTMGRHAVLVFALTFPTAVTWVYFVALATAPSFWQQGAYLVGKIVQFALPVVWVFAFEKNRFSWRLSRSGIGLGIASGLAIMLATLGGYSFVLKPLDFFHEAEPAIRAKVQGMGVDSSVAFAAMGLFYSLMHSGLEEYYWRWFVFRRLRAVTPLAFAVIVSSLGFMAHHVLVLATFFGNASPATYLFSLGVAVGGVIWSLLYERSKSLLGPWISHALVDAGIFLVGYDLVRNLFS